MLAKGMKHERTRFSNLTEKQLNTRLNKITKVEKLQRFVIVAGEFEYKNLQKKALNKLSWIRVN